MDFADLKELENSLEEQKKDLKVQHDAEMTAQREEHERVNRPLIP